MLTDLLLQDSSQRQVMILEAYTTDPEGDAVLRLNSGLAMATPTCMDEQKASLRVDGLLSTVALYREEIPTVTVTTLYESLRHKAVVYAKPNTILRLAAQTSLGIPFVSAPESSLLPEDIVLGLDYPEHLGIYWKCKDYCEIMVFPESVTVVRLI